MAAKWHNWSSSVQCTPRTVVKPTDLQHLIRLIHGYARDGRHVRVVGAGHSFSPLVHTDDVLLSLENLQGIESVDEEKNQVCIWGGTHLHKLGDELLTRGLAQENLGDIDKQSISGAICTGTHGTGAGFGTISTQVEGMTLVTSNGEIIECSEEHHPDIFKAAQTSLGALAIIVKVTLRTVPAQKLHYKGYRERLSTVLTHLERYKQENSHFEFFWFPNTEWAQVKFINKTGDTPVRKPSIVRTLNQMVLENWSYWMISEMCRLRPAFSRTASKISAAGLVSISEVNYGHRLFPALRMVKFQEMEYSLPAEHAQSVLEQIRTMIKHRRINVHFPVECRFVKADDIWLSPAYGRDSAYIAIHMYKGMPYKDYFEAAETVYRRYHGRPHWGKIHTLDYRTLSQLYPRWSDFLRVRRQLDPAGTFLNDYLRSIFGVDAAAEV
jgi:FAD-linked oxidoreductase